MVYDPNAPTGPGDAAADQATGSGEGLDVAPDTAPETPDVTDQADGTSGDEELFSETDTQGLPEDAQARVQGMVAKFTKTQQQLKERERQLAEIVDKLGREQQIRESEISKPAQAQGADEVEDVLSGLDPAARAVFEKFGKAIESRLRKEYEPTRQQAGAALARADLIACQNKYKDFDQVLPIQAVQQMAQQNPSLNIEQMYKLRKFEALQQELGKAKGELGRHQLRQKQRASSTEMPQGPAAADLDFTWYEKMPYEERINLSSAQIAERMNKARGV